MSNVAKSIRISKKALFAFNYNYLKSLLIELFDWEGIPSSVDIYYMSNKLLTNGYVIIYMTDDGELIATDGAISGVSHYNTPLYVYTTSPVLPSKRLTIGIDCAVIYNTWNKETPQSLEDDIYLYASKMTNIDLSIQAGSFNSRVSAVFSVRDDVQLQQYRQFYDKISDGEPAVSINSNNLLDKDIPVTFLPVKNSFVVPELLESKRKIVNEFLTYVGCPIVPYEKNERLITGEIRNPESDIRRNILLAPRIEGCNNVNNLFGESWTVKMRGEIIERINSSVR